MQATVTKMITCCDAPFSCRTYGINEKRNLVDKLDKNYEPQLVPMEIGIEHSKQK